VIAIDEMRSLFFSLAPAAAPPPPPPVVTINYRQIGECGSFPQDFGDPGAAAGSALVVFGIDSITNATSTAFAFNAADLFVPLDAFSFQNAAPPASCCSSTNCPSSCPEALFPTPYPGAIMTVPANSTLPLKGASTGTQFVMMEAAASQTTAETSFFLSYSTSAGIAPSNGGSLNPNVTLVKTNASASDTASLPLVQDCSTINLM
jgi:hypothetical protein